MKAKIGWIRLLGFCCLALAFLAPIVIELVPRVILIYYQRVNPRRYHYYYFAPDATGPSYATLLLGLTFACVGIGLLVLDHWREEGLKRDNGSED